MNNRQVMGNVRETVPKPTTYGMVLTVAGVRRDYRETKKISWSIKESDFARLMSFPSSSRRERISSSGPLGKEMVHPAFGDNNVWSFGTLYQDHITLYCDPVNCNLYATEHSL